LVLCSRAADPKPVAVSGGAGSRRPTMPSTRWLAIRAGQKSVVCERVGGGHSQERASAGRSCIWCVLRWRLGRVGSAEVSIGAREGQRGRVAGSTERLTGHQVMLLLRSVCEPLGPKTRVLSTAICLHHTRPVAGSLHRGGVRAHPPPPPPPHPP
jgi:hypothetical protein